MLDRSGRLLVLEVPPPQDVEGEGPLGALRAWAIEHAPGREARALRIAIGSEGREPRPPRSANGRVP